MKTTVVIVPWKEGIHLLRAGSIAQLAARFRASIICRLGGKVADARSVISILILCAGLGATLEIEASGPDEREAIQAIAGHLFPVKWRSFKTAEASIDKWEFDKNGAHALLDGGKSGEVKLKAFPGMTGEPVVIKNLPYWGAPRNDGFVMMPNEVEAYRVGPNAFEFKGTNGFMLTVDIASKDIKPKPKPSMD
jgi:phosphotransferase system HPr (HPr) family protein